MKVQVVQKDTFETIRLAVNKAVDLIKPTYGPAGNKVIISKVLNKMVLDDGVQICRDLEFDNPAENAVLQIVRETSGKTNDRVGDGTTGALIMLQAIIEQVAKRNHRDSRKIEKELKLSLEQCKSQLLKMVKPIKTREDLLKVARISFDDPKIAELIADTWWKLGKDGVITVDKSQTMETSVDVTDGVKINRGYISPYMITNPQRMESVIEKPYILLTDYRLTEANDVLPAMNLLASKNITSMVIIAESVETSALATLIVNKIQGKFNTLAIVSPGGENRINFLEDVALMTGAKVFSEHKGDKIDTIKLEDFGRADRMISKRAESIIVGPKGKKDVIKKAIFDLDLAITQTKDEREKEGLKQRMARLANKIAVIKVGAPTENEANALKYKVDDSVAATHSAFKDGVVCGAGLALSRINTSSDIMNEALQAPFRQLKENMGIENHANLGKDEAINVVTGEVGDFLKVGVVDPVDVLIAGVESAVSIASLLITTTGMIVEHPKEIKREED